MANCPQLAGSRGKGDRFYAPSHSLRRSLAAVCACGSPFRSYELISSTEINRERILREFVVEFSSNGYLMTATTICCVDEGTMHDI